MEIMEFARLLEEVAKKSSTAVPEPVPPLPTPNIDTDKVKQAIKTAAIGGVKTLQIALSVPPDGIIGEITNRALSNIDIQTLLTNLSNIQPAPSPPKPDSLSFEVLAPEYRDLFKNSKILPKHKKDADAIANAIVKNQPRYTPITNATKVPEHVIGIIHSLECSLSFSRHLHNGDPLSSRTVNEPAGRPIDGNPPFTFEESAIDALHYDGMDQWTDWSPEGLAYVLERYNGFGYRKYHPSVKSPYLWSFTDAYTSGKYDVDGHFNPSLTSDQCGGMAILKELTQWT